MTEAEWLSSTDSHLMLDSFKGRVSDRKLRLFAVACCQAMWQHFTHERSRSAVVVAERFADGLASEEELNRAHSMAMEAIARWEDVKYGSRVMINIDRNSLPHLRMRHAVVASHVNKPFLIGRLRGYGRDPELAGVAPTLVRDIFGNLFHSGGIDPYWQTETVVSLAAGIYAERAFDRMPILADALEDAGCDNAEVLDHCRQPDAVHVRGCWVLDKILGKE